MSVNAILCGCDGGWLQRDGKTVFVAKIELVAVATKREGIGKK